MKRTDTDIHGIELLLVLDYLFNNTDKEHPENSKNNLGNLLPWELKKLR